MKDAKAIMEKFHARLTVLAGHQGEVCPSFKFEEKYVGRNYAMTKQWASFGDERIGEWQYKQLADWMETAPAPDSNEYVECREKFIEEAICAELLHMTWPQRHADRSVTYSRKEWAAALERVGKRLMQKEDSMLALLGPRGTGKTQMAVELIRLLTRQRIGKSVKPSLKLERWAWCNSYDKNPRFAFYSNTMDFFLRLRKTYQPEASEHEDDVLSAYIAPTLLVLDEAHDRRGSDWENQMFTYLVDRRYQAGNKQTIFIANQTAEEFEGNIGSSIADRLQECGGIVNCNWESFRRG